MVLSSARIELFQWKPSVITIGSHVFCYCGIQREAKKTCQVRVNVAHWGFHTNFIIVNGKYKLWKLTNFKFWVCTLFSMNYKYEFWIIFIYKIPLTNIFLIFLFINRYYKFLLRAKFHNYMSTGSISFLPYKFSWWRISYKMQKNHANMLIPLIAWT